LAHYQGSKGQSATSDACYPAQFGQTQTRPSSLGSTRADCKDVPFKQQSWQAKRTAVDHKCCVHFAIMCYPITLDQVLEANDICDGFVAVILHFSVILKPPPLLIILRAFAALIIFNGNIFFQHRSKVNWLFKRNTFLRIKLVNFLYFRASTVFGWCSSSISLASWK
jgi:hypothetical protein